METWRGTLTLVQDILIFLRRRVTHGLHEKPDSERNSPLAFFLLAELILLRKPPTFELIVSSICIFSFLPALIGEY